MSNWQYYGPRYAQNWYSLENCVFRIGQALSNRYKRSYLERFEAMQERLERQAWQLKESRYQNVSAQSQGQELMKELHQLIEQCKSDSAAAERGETYDDSHRHN